MSGDYKMVADITVSIARLWRLPDGTNCGISRDQRVWTLALTRGDVLLRYRHFDQLEPAYRESKRWRAELTGQAQPLEDGHA